MQILKEPSRVDFEQKVKRSLLDSRDLEASVRGIMKSVAEGGDAALHEYNKRFDSVEREFLKVQEAEFEAAVGAVKNDLQDAIKVAYKNIYKFHEQQREAVHEVETMPGVCCWRESRPISSVGLYVPAGSAPLFSTLLMLAVPAKIAGCTQISVCTPAAPSGEIHPAILCTAKLIGVTDVFAVGGAQAIAALAYGTETIPKAYKIFGPGNQYVTQAKQLASAQGIAIDMPAGPTELAIYADKSAAPDEVAADILAQLEHGVDSQVILFVPTVNLYEAIKTNLDAQLQQLARQAIASESLKNSYCIIQSDPERVAELINCYAPEHLILAISKARAFSVSVTNAGSIFIGRYAAESLGDYATGTNHTLPTNAAAKAFSGVSLDSFIKKITFQEVSAIGIQSIGPSVVEMAYAEGLQGHAEAVAIRLRNLNGNR